MKKLNVAVKSQVASAAVVASKSKGRRNTRLPLALVFNNLQIWKNKDYVPGLYYTFQDLCGKEYWMFLTEREKSMSFTCMEFLIEHKELPLEYAGMLESGDHIYCLK